MPPTERFRKGDVILHARRPEWGCGTVDQVSTIEHEGAPAQRLVVLFPNHGRVTLNTAVAPLTLQESPSNMSTASSATDRQSNNWPKPKSPESNGGWLDSLAGKKHGHSELWELPEPMIDPFATLPARLAATLGSFRFSTEARSLIDWAVAQTRLNDPLSKYSRSELERGFDHFARTRESHLLDLVRQIKKAGQPQALNEALTAAPNPAARNALMRAIKSA